VRADGTTIEIQFMHALNDRVVPLVLLDASGQEVPRLSPAGSEANGPLLVSIPAGDTLRRSFPGGYRYAMDPPRIWLRTSTFVAWDITSVREQLHLRGAVTPYVPSGAQQRGWTGTLQLPPVALPPR
jgi:hypothetical protein